MQITLFTTGDFLPSCTKPEVSILLVVVKLEPKLEPDGLGTLWTTSFFLEEIVTPITKVGLDKVVRKRSLYANWGNCDIEQTHSPEPMPRLTNSRNIFFFYVYEILSDIGRVKASWTFLPQVY